MDREFLGNGHGIMGTGQSAGQPARRGFTVSAQKHCLAGVQAELGPEGPEAKCQ